MKDGSCVEEILASGDTLGKVFGLKSIEWIVYNTRTKKFSA